MWYTVKQCRIKLECNTMWDSLHYTDRTARTVWLLATHQCVNVWWRKLYVTGARCNRWGKKENKEKQNQPTNQPTTKIKETITGMQSKTRTWDIIKVKWSSLQNKQNLVLCLGHYKVHMIIFIISMSANNFFCVCISRFDNLLYLILFDTKQFC